MSELLKINVNEHIEKKNRLSYLSWAWAWAEVLKIDPQAVWNAAEFNGLPCAFLPDSSAMVQVTVTIKGHTKQCWLPVMNHRNQAIKNPDAFAINTAIVRCLTKCISMHGLGLYIYAGEDLPEEDTVKAIKQPALGGIGSDIPEEEQKWLQKIAEYLGGLVRSNKVESAQDKFQEYALNETQSLYMQSFLGPKERKALGMTYVKAA
jgi:hypothetical protein